MLIREFFRAKLVAPIKAQLVQGADPKSLALSCAVGVACGAFPLFGFTTLLALIIGLCLRLNQVALQSVNYLMAPVQLIMIPIFGYAASRIGEDQHLDLNPVAIVKQFGADPGKFLQVYGWLGFKAVCIWALVAPFAGYIVFRLTLSSFNQIVRRR